MSLGRTSTFLDVYLERDIANGLIDESQAQEMIDHFIMKLRMVRFLRTPEYGSLFSGDPIWATEAMAGMGVDGRTLVSKTTFRYLHTLHTMGAAPEPNMTILWSEQLPEAFKQYAAKVSIDTSSVQYVTALNIIHYSHDRYSYEASLMALMDRDVHHTMACGIAGLSIVADSLAAIKYATVKPVRDEDGIAVDFEIEGDYPKFGNNDARVDDIACDLVERFMKKIQKMHTYREAVPNQSILTITSNVVYGKKPVIRQMAVAQVCLLALVQTQCTVVMKKVRLRLWHRYLNCRLLTRKMVFLTPSQLCLTHWVKVN